MPIAASDFYSPGTQYVPYILEDKYFKGSYRVFDTIAARDQYLVDAKAKSFGGAIEQFDSRKKMMLCGVIQTPGIIYYLDDTKENWVELELGKTFELEAPLEYLGADEDRLSINPEYLIPQQGRGPGKALVVRSDGTIGWEFRGGIAGVRVTKIYQPLNNIDPGQEHTFELDLGMTVMLLKVEVNTVDFELRGFVSELRNDRNPYLFRSSVDFLTDEGMRYDNGQYVRERRFALLANLSENPSNLQYMSLKNIGPATARPTVTITALTLQ